MSSLSSASSSVLSPDDIEHFITYGFIKVTGCFDTAPGSTAHRWATESWARNGLPPDDLSKWPLDKIHMPATEDVPVRDFSPKAFAAICELCGGEERIIEKLTWGNGFIANYGLGRDQPWQPPSAEVEGWHVDGDWFQHFLDSGDQALLIVALFSDLHSQGAGTFIACDSVGVVAREFAAHPEGFNPFKIPSARLVRECRDFREATGRAGDVFLLHPFILHTSSFNHRPEARLMINPAAILREPMRLDRQSDRTAYSPVEQGVLRGLGVEHYDFQPTAPRQMIVPPRVAMQKKMREKELERLAAAR